MASPDRIAGLIVAAGSGSRVGGDVPKQFRTFRGQPMLRHSYSAMRDHPSVDTVFVVIAHDQQIMAEASLGNLPMPIFVIGGATRRESVRNGLQAIADTGGAGQVLSHDAARPDLPAGVVDALLQALVEFPGAVPALPAVDSMARGNDCLDATVERDRLWRIQTPQAFHFKAIYGVHRNWSEGEPTDDARMLMAAGLAVKIVPGDERLAKYTFESDFTEHHMSSIRTGSGFDVHRLVSGEELWLCGVLVPHDMGLSGHSDADVALHALTDAVLGAMALGDIGDHFPPSDAQWRGASSDQFLRHAIGLCSDAGYRVANTDVTIICEAPKIGPHKAAMRARLAEIIGADVSQISVKATTTEMLGFTGRGEGIAAQAVVTLETIRR